MDNLEVKVVPFMGSNLVAAQDNNGQIWVGVRWMCEGIGLSHDQMRNERRKIQSDRVLAKGGSNLALLTNGGIQDTFCLKLEFLPLWLAKINITPAMEANHPEVADRLVNYQLKVKDVLAEAFLPGRQRFNVPKDYVSALRAYADEVERNLLLEEQNAVKDQQIAEMKPKATYYDIVLSCTDSLCTSVIAKDYGKSAKWLNQYLHDKGVQYKCRDTWLLYQKYAELGYTSTKTHTYTGNDSKDHAKVHTYWTQKGRLFIYELLKSDGILPLIEQGNILTDSENLMNGKEEE